MICTDKISIRVKGKIYTFPCGRCYFCTLAKKLNRKGFFVRRLLNDLYP